MLSAAFFLFRMSLILISWQVQQKKMVDDTERRLNVLFDALNCETLEPSTVEALHEIIQGTLSPSFLKQGS